jgi:hypothetical protein
MVEVHYQNQAVLGLPPCVGPCFGNGLIRVVYFTHNALPEILLFRWAEAAMRILQAHHANWLLTAF